MDGKGSTRRPQQVTDEDFISNWDKIFKKWIECPYCRGKGVRSKFRSYDNVKEIYEDTCEACNGAGKVEKKAGVW